MVFTLAHLSDIHLAPLSRLSTRHYFSKRLLGFWNWKRGRSAVHDIETLKALAADLLLQQPDHIALTGDLTNLGLRQEYEGVQKWLRVFAPPDKISLIPGNHDAYVPGALETGLEVLAEWLPRADKSGELFPYVHERGEIALVGLSSAFPSLPFMSTGIIGTAQLHRLEEALKRLGAEKKFRIVLVHHPLQVKRSERSKRLRDAAALQKVLVEYGAELVLHGHLHRPGYQMLDGKHGTIHVFGVPSASAHPRFAHDAAGYALYRITQEPQGWQVAFSRRTLGLDGTFETHDEKIISFKA